MNIPARCALALTIIFAVSTCSVASHKHQDYNQPKEWIEPDPSDPAWGAYIQRWLRFGWESDLDRPIGEFLKLPPQEQHDQMEKIMLLQNWQQPDSVHEAAMQRQGIRFDDLKVLNLRALKRRIREIVAAEELFHNPTRSITLLFFARQVNAHEQDNGWEVGDEPQLGVRYMRKRYSAPGAEEEDEEDQPEERIYRIDDLRTDEILLRSIFHADKLEITYWRVGRGERFWVLQQAGAGGFPKTFRGTDHEGNNIEIIEEHSIFDAKGHYAPGWSGPKPHRQWKYTVRVFSAKGKTAFDLPFFMQELKESLLITRGIDNSLREDASGARAFINAEVIGGPLIRPVALPPESPF